MANRSYLFVSDHDGICPAWVEGVEEPEQLVLAEDVYCVPLLWLALFRPADLRTTTFPADEDDDVAEFPVTAPLATKERALAQLDAALPTLNRLFAAEGPLDEHAALLRDGIAGMPGGFVTVDLYEIAVLRDEDAYHRTLRAALASFEEPGDAAADRERLVDLAQLRPGRPFPPARLLLDERDAADDDWWNFVRLLGAGFVRPVPWEKAAG